MKKKPTKKKDLANRRVTLGLFFAEEGNRNGISVSDKEYKDAVYREAMNYPGKEQDLSNSLIAIQVLKSKLLLLFLKIKCLIISSN